MKNKPMPKSSSPKIEDAPCIAMASAPMSTGQSTASERPLAVIVDDEIHCCELLGGWMAELGYRVASFDSAWPALDFIRTAHPAVLVCDVVMPSGLDGLGLARLALVGNFDMSVVITTGFSAGIVGYHNGRVPGIGAVLHKPFGKADLHRTLRQTRIASNGAGHAPLTTPYSRTGLLPFKLTRITQCTAW